MKTEPREYGWIGIPAASPVHQGKAWNRNTAFRAGGEPPGADGGGSRRLRHRRRFRGSSRQAIRHGRLRPEDRVRAMVVDPHCQDVFGPALRASRFLPGHGQGYGDGLSGLSQPRGRRRVLRLPCVRPHRRDRRDERRGRARGGLLPVDRDIALDGRNQGPGGDHRPWFAIRLFQDNRRQGGRRHRRQGLSVRRRAAGLHAGNHGLLPQVRFLLCHQDPRDRGLPGTDLPPDRHLVGGNGRQGRDGSRNPVRLVPASMAGRGLAVHVLCLQERARGR